MKQKKKKWIFHKNDSNSLVFNPRKVAMKNLRNIVLGTALAFSMINGHVFAAAEAEAEMQTFENRKGDVSIDMNEVDIIVEGDGDKDTSLEQTNLYNQVLDALKKGKPKCAYSLIQKISNINLQDDGQKTLLHWVVWYGGDRACVTLLLDRSADVNAKDCDGNTPLHIYCMRALDNMGEYCEPILRKRGGDYSIQNNNGETPEDLLPWLLRHCSVS